MINDLRYRKKQICFSNWLNVLLLSASFFSFSFFSYAQIKATVDTTSIKIGEQILYGIEVENDTTNIVYFPEGQTFLPLEMVESYKIDTTKKDAKLNLIKRYGLTQFDSGTYTIPRQKIVIANKIYHTDSIQVKVNAVKIDTTKQKLYDIKPILEANKSVSNWWKYALLILLIFFIIGFLLYWFLWRKKSLTEEEEIALLLPYDRAKLALKKLDETNYLENNKLKDYYSELTFIIRRYLDEKVYDRALESTTDELISRLQLLKEGNQIKLTKDDIHNIQTILKRADLVKFAKSSPDKALAKIDRSTIDLEIDQVKEALPEPTEEEKLLDQQYKDEQERKNKRKKIIITIAVSVFLLLATLTTLIINYGFNYVKDTIIGHPSKELLEEKNWITSEYGAPGITLTTPKVLQRVEVPIPEEMKDNIEAVGFAYGSLVANFNISTTTTKFKNLNPEQAQDDEGNNAIDLTKSSEDMIKYFEQQGVQNIFTKYEQFITPNGQEGLKTYGTADFPTPQNKNTQECNYIILGFTTKSIMQNVILVWKTNDEYADQIIERVVNSIELLKLDDDKKE